MVYIKDKFRGLNQSPKSSFCSQFLHPLAPNHTTNADDYEGDAEQLTHVQEHVGLERLLNVFCVFDEEAGGEDIGEAETKEKACANLL